MFDDANNNLPAPSFSLDAFGGSGTTLVVAKKLERRFIGFELSKNYAQQIQSRLQITGMEVPLQVSYELLEPDWQKKLAYLSILAAPFDRNTAIAVWNIDQESAQIILDNLYNASLLDGNVQSGFQLPNLVRAALKITLPFAISVFLIQGLFWTNGTPIVDLGPLSLKREGLLFAAQSTGRILNDMEGATDPEATVVLSIEYGTSLYTDVATVVAGDDGTWALPDVSVDDLGPPAPPADATITVIFTANGYDLGACRLDVET